MSECYRYMVCAQANEAGRALLPGAIPAASAAGIEWCSDGKLARARAAANADLEAIWVVSCASVDPINLAAALKADHPALTVFLVVPDKTGSVASRVQAAGIDEVVPADAFVEHLIARVGGAEQCAPKAPPLSSGDGAGAGFVLAVASGAGGVGKSTAAVLLAWLGVRRGLRTALVDGDLQFGDLAELSGPCAQVPIEAVAADAAALDEVADEPMVLVRAPRTLERSEAVGASLGEVAETLGARFDLVVVNTGGSWGDQHISLLERSAAALFLVDQRASSIRACRHALDLCLRCGIATGSFLLAVNRCGRHAPFTSIDVSSALSGAHVVELADGGSEVEELLGAGMASQLVEAGNPLCQSLDRVIDELLPSSSRGRRGVESAVARLGMGPAKGRRAGSTRKRGRRRAVAAAGDEAGGRR